MAPDTAAPDTATNEAPRTGASRAILIGAIVAGSVGGAAVGWLAIGPLLSPDSAAAADAHATHAAAQAEGEHAPASTAPILLNNLVLNPADSRGTRFLLVSVGLQLGPSATAEEFEKRETEVRDRVLQVLARKSIDDLVDVSRRDDFRREIAATVDSLLGAGQVRGVFFPQFVIQ
jgi:flagellar FliL protein